MKKLTLFALFAITFCACQRPSTQNSKYFVSTNAHNLVESYRNIVSETNTNLCPYPGDSVIANRRSNYLAMPLNGYKGSKKEGYISFLSYNFFEYKFVFDSTTSIKPAIVSFRTIWMSEADKTRFPICENCYPKPIVLPDSLIDHVFQVVFVPVNAYQSSGISDTDYIGDSPTTNINSILNLAVNSTDIKAINEIFIEEDEGFSEKKFPQKFSSEYSSVGLISEVVLKNNEKVLCYIFNNEDLISERFKWKVKK